MEKTLNNQQRKMLDKIYSEELDNKIRDYRNSRAAKLKALKETQKKSILNTHKAKIKKIQDAAKLINALNQELNTIGYQLVTSGPVGAYDSALQIDKHKIISIGEIGRHNATENNLVKLFNEDTNRSLASLTDLKNEMRADIYGLTISYSEIRKELDKKINSLQLA